MGKLITSVKAGANALKLSYKRNEPKILLVGGIAAVVGGTVLACNATLKVPDILDERNKKIDEIRDKYALTDSQTDDGVGVRVVTKEEKNDILAVHAKTALNIGAQYAPAVTVGGLGVMMLTKSNSVLTKRYLAMTAAYGALQKEFSEYRQCVIREYGEAVDKAFIFGAEQKVLQTVDEDGEVKSEEKIVFDISKFGEMSMNSHVLFDEKSSLYEDNAVVNERLVSMVVHNANEKLNARGRHNPNARFFLNETLDMLDLPRTAAGNILGWTFDPENPTKITYDILQCHALDDNTTLVENDTSKIFYYADDDEPRMWIRFNVDGNVLENM